jgi:hypothetical protein
LLLAHTDAGKVKLTSSIYPCLIGRIAAGRRSKTLAKNPLFQGNSPLCRGW